MKKFIIHWNAGFGDQALVIEAENRQEAERECYERWLEECEGEAHRETYEFSPELAEKLEAEDLT